MIAIGQTGFARQLKHLGDEEGDAMQRDGVDRWLRAYVEACETYDPERIAAFDGDTAIATDSSRYSPAPGIPPNRVFDNCFVIRFDASGRCRESPSGTSSARIHPARTHEHHLAKGAP
jgi:hypothetical protein